MIAVAIRNRDRILLMWPLVHDYLAAIMAPEGTSLARCTPLGPVVKSGREIDLLEKTHMLAMSSSLMRDRHTSKELMGELGMTARHAHSCACSLQELENALKRAWAG